MLIEKLAHESGLPVNRLKFFAKTALNRYFVFSIPKRSGGVRQISHPARPLKAVQRWINARYFVKLPLHDSAMAYRKGRNIRLNADAHVNSNFTLRLDFKNFFPSFTPLHVYQYLKDQQNILEIDDFDIHFVTQIVCRRDGLTIGAPTSPILTNAMMYSFDKCVDDYCRDRDMIYTRYADDVFISTKHPHVLADAYRFVRGQADLFCFADLKVNRNKTAFLSRRYRRSVTGLVLTPDGRVSLGRVRKKEIKSLLHRYLVGTLSGSEVPRLQGLLSFATDVEPTFIRSLDRKYGEDYHWMLNNVSGSIATTFGALESLDPKDILD